MGILVGTSGWQYRDWRDVLYPAGVAQRRWLEYYAGRYATVENNGSFYRLPGERTFADWRARTPPGFVMTVKASRYLTHVRRLADPAEPVGRLLRAAAGLGERLGPVLLQLPPNLPADPGALEECLRQFAAFPPDGPGLAQDPGSQLHRPVRVAVEFRHDSWSTGEIRELLVRYNAALCWADRRGRPVSPLWRTADWGYLRLHEGAAQPWPRYGERALRGWVERIAGTWPDDADVFAYFNNDQHGAAIYDAAALASVARDLGRAVTPAADPLPPGNGGHR
jgi:uncharacterized protein YecE (DUF72 family)